LAAMVFLAKMIPGLLSLGLSIYARRLSRFSRYSG
jgi:hypothetical protein